MFYILMLICVAISVWMVGACAVDLKRSFPDLTVPLGTMCCSVTYIVWYFTH